MKSQEVSKERQQGPNTLVASSTRSEKVWRCLFYIAIFGGSIIIKKVYEFHNLPQFENVKKGSIYDCWISIVAAIVIMCLRYLIKKYMINFMLSLLSAKRIKSPLQAQKKAEQFCKWFFDIFYYTFTTITAYLIIRKANFLPSYLGGSGSCSNVFTTHPHVADIKYLRTFYLVQLGSHLYTFINQVYSKRNDSKFYEYALHHSLALFLIWFSYMMNFTQVGMLVLLLHDPADVFLILARAYTEYKNQVLSVNLVIYALCYQVWIYTRIISFPLCCIVESIRYLQNPPLMNLPTFNSSYYYLIGMEIALLVLHVYWLIYLTKAALSMAKHGQDKSGYEQ